MELLFSQEFSHKGCYAAKMTNEFLVIAAKPRNPWTYLAIIGVGQATISYTLSGSIDTPSLVMVCPKYLTC